MSKELTAERLREVLDYDPETGVFRWKARRRCPAAGAIAGAINSRGYRNIVIDRRSYVAHRLAWLYSHGAWPKAQIDHISGARDDNRLANLRDVDNTTNHENRRRPQKNGTTGFLGVSRSSAKSTRFVAQIQAAGQHRYLGSFATAEAAHAAYITAKRQLHPGSTL